MKIEIADVGRILRKINDAEIRFRFENLPCVGFRWAVVGYEGEPEPGQLRLYRAEIDDSLDGTFYVPEKMPDSLKFLGFTDDMFSNKDAAEQYKSLHLMQKDWHERGEDDDILIAIRDLSIAICKYYPESEFTTWFQSHWPTSEQTA
jgi:hypothetical protein